MPTVNPFVGSGGTDFYSYDDTVTTSGVGSPAMYHSGDMNAGGIHLCVGAMLALAIGVLVLINLGGFRAMVAVG